MSVDLSKVILDSNTPAWRNYESGTFDITFSGTLAVPSGGSYTTLEKSGFTSFSQDAEVAKIYIKSDTGIDKGSFGSQYNAGDLLDISAFPRVRNKVQSNACMVTDWNVDLITEIENGRLDVTLQAVNAGGTTCALTFVSTVYTIVYVAFLPTQ